VVNPWNDQLRMLKPKTTAAPRQNEKRPFQIVPFVLYLTREENNVSAEAHNGVNAGLDSDQRP
jgi:hypothetical protein